MLVLTFKHFTGALIDRLAVHGHGKMMVSQEIDMNEKPASVVLVW